MLKWCAFLLVGVVATLQAQVPEPREVLIGNIWNSHPQYVHFAEDGSGVTYKIATGTCIKEEDPGRFFSQSCARKVGVKRFNWAIHSASPWTDPDDEKCEDASGWDLVMKFGKGDWDVALHCQYFIGWSFEIKIGNKQLLMFGEETDPWAYVPLPR